MRIAITFRDQTEQKRHGNKRDYTHLSRREAESLPHFIEFETSALFHYKRKCRRTQLNVTSPSSRRCRAGFPACSFRRRQGCLFDETGTMPVLQPGWRSETFVRSTTTHHGYANIFVAFSVLPLDAAEPEPNDNVS
jgi:hypothetical protein